MEDTDYVQEVEQIIYNHSKISIENALVLNRQLRVNLTDLKAELERMLDMCQKKYKENEKTLNEMSKLSKSGPNSCATYYFCGYPFFKVSFILLHF